MNVSKLMEDHKIMFKIKRDSDILLHIGSRGESIERLASQEMCCV